MASVFDQQIRTGLANDPLIKAPVERNYVGPAVGLLAEAGVTIAREGAVSSLTGDGKTVAEVAADESLLPQEDSTEAEKSAALNSIDTLSKLASARKAGLNSQQARTRATAILKRSINENPLFADDIRKAYTKFFGGTGGGGLFDLTPEEKALEEYKESVTTRALELNIEPNQAAASIRKEREQSIRKTELEVSAKERTMNSDSYVTYADINSTAAIDAIMRKVMADINSNGALSPEKVQEYKAQLRVAGSTLKSEQHSLLRDEAGNPVLDMVDSGGIKSAGTLIDTRVASAIDLIDDQTALKLSADNYGLLGNKFNTAVIHHYGAFKAVKDALGEQASSLYFQKMLGNSAYSTVARNDPFVRKILRAGENFSNDLAGATASAFSFATGVDANVTGSGAGAANNVSGEASDEAKAGWLSFLFTEDKAPVIPKLTANDSNKVNEITKMSLAESPEALSIFKKPYWTRRVAQSKEYAEVVGSAVAGAAENVRRSIVGELGSFDVSGITIQTREEAGVSVPRWVQERGGGTRDVLWVNGVENPVIVERIQGVFDVARANPSIWEGEYESSLDYTRAVIGVGGAARPTTTQQVPAAIPDAVIDMLMADPDVKATGMTREQVIQSVRGNDGNQ